MSLDLENIALHQLVKRDEQQLEVVLRDSLLAPSAVVDETMAELHRVYNAKSKAYGTFTPDSELAQALTHYRKGEDTFLQFSRAATGRLRDELAKYPFADGGDRAVLPVSLSGGGLPVGRGAQQLQQHACQ
ncbi:Nucleoid-associated protein YejK [Edwardsiella tarda]|nr:Nucleoid-associated protein YejK [Edwardsiella tarda]